MPHPALTMLPLQAQGATRSSSALSTSQQMRHRRSSTGGAAPPSAPAEGGRLQRKGLLATRLLPKLAAARCMS